MSYGVNVSAGSRIARGARAADMKFPDWRRLWVAFGWTSGIEVQLPANRRTNAGVCGIPAFR